MREGLLALSVGVGLKVMNELIEEELTQLVGPKGKNDRARRQAPRLQAGASGLGRTQGPGPAPPAAHRQRQGGVEVAHLLALRLRDLLQEQTVERVLAELSTRYRAASSPPPPRTARCRARRCRGAS
jgi:putative transposase